MNSGKSTPHSRRAAGAVVHGDKFMLYGGFGISGTVDPADNGADFWEYSDGWRRIETSGPYGARYPALCSTPEGIYFFGGCTHDGRRLRFMNQLWLYDGRSWIFIRPSGEPQPPGRYTSTLACFGKQLLVFGGNSQHPEKGKCFYGDLWAFDLNRNRWEMLHDEKSGPGPRYGFGWTQGPEGLYVFGGFDGTADRNDLWLFEAFSRKWRLLAEGMGPPPRYCPALGWTNGELVLFGGRSKINSRNNFADTWVYSQGWECLTYPPREPSPGYHAKSGYAAGGAALWLFGGEGPAGHLSDFWKFSRRRWTQVHGCRTDDPILW